MEKILLDSYFNFFDTHIKDLTKFFQTNEIQNKINQLDSLIKIYMKSHYVKSHNLILSLFLLARGINEYKLPDEAKIIFRSLFEHILNFMYIFSKDNDDEKIKLIQEYNNFFKIQPFKFAYNMSKITITKETSEIKKMMCSNAQKICMDNNLEELFRNFYKKCKKYKKNKNTWHGNTIQNLIIKISEKYGDEFLLFEKYYSAGNLYTHCNVMNYINEKGIIEGNASLINVLDTLDKGLSFYISYIDWFYRCIGIKIFEDIFPKVLENHNLIEDNYEKLKQSKS